MVIDEKDKDKSNRRDHKLFVDRNNLLVVVPMELEDFESHYFKLLDTVIKKVKNGKRHSKSPKDSPFILLFETINIFHTMVIAYLFCSMANWPKIIHDTETLNKLYIVLLTKVAEIQSRLSQALSGERDPGLSTLPIYMLGEHASVERLLEYHNTFKKFNMEEEIIHVIRKIHPERVYGSLDGKVFPS